MFTGLELQSDFSNLGEQPVFLFKFLFWTPRWDGFNFPFVDYFGSVRPGADYFLAVT